MHMFLRARLLRRRRLRWFLVQARRRMFAFWEKLVALCSCCTRKTEEADPAMVPSAADSETRSPAAQPIGSLEELKDRVLLASPILEFLKSSVPLSVNLRAKRPQLLVCHDYKGGYQEDKWVQGRVGMEGYVLWHWHLVDVFVYFSHSLVTVPPPGWINAAHKHGVPVLGTFITERAHGASVCRSLLASAETCCMYASRLAELADTLGFDGWLINIENEVDMKDIPRLHLFVQHLRQCMHSRIANSYVIWYDAVTEEGELDWQDCLNEKNRFFFGDSDGLFTNYTWTEEMPKLSAHAAGERATDVYMGVDVFGRNTFGGGGFHCDKALKVARNAQVSAALFAPGWVYETNQPPSFEVAQTRWWRHIGSCWPIARCNPLRLPFFTDFNRGCGRRLSVEGNEVSTQPWFNLSCQNLQPILEVIAQPHHLTNQSSLEVSMSYEAAYSGGSCLRISGSDNTLGLVQLYESYVSIKETPLHIAHSVQVDHEFHICLALQFQRDKNSRFLVLLVGEEEAKIEMPPTLQNCIIQQPLHNAGVRIVNPGSSKWVVRKHMLELGTCTLNQIYAVTYSHKLEVQKLFALLEEDKQATIKPFTHSDAVEKKDRHFAHEVLLGHIRIATSPEHDRVLPKIIFEGVQPEWTQKSESWKSVSLTLRWGLDSRGGTRGNCHWVQYHVYVTQDGEPGDPPGEFLGVAVAQAFSVQELLIHSSCNMLHFHVQGHCVCGLLEALSPACSVDVSSLHHRHWTSDIGPSQPLLKMEDVV